MSRNKIKELVKKIKDKEKQLKKTSIEAKKYITNIKKKVTLPTRSVKEIKEINQNQFSETERYFDKVRTEEATRIYKPDIKIRNLIKMQLNNDHFRKNQINTVDKYCTNYIFTEEQNAIDLNNIETATNIFNSSVECEIIKTNIIGSHGFIKHLIRIREDKWIRIHSIDQIDLVTPYTQGHFKDISRFYSAFPSNGAVNQFLINQMYGERQYKHYKHKFVRGRCVSGLQIQNFWYGGNDYELETVASQGNSTLIFYENDGYYLCCCLDYWTDTGLILNDSVSELSYRYRYAETILRSKENINMYKDGGDLWIIVYVHPSGGLFGNYTTQKIRLYQRKITKVTGKINVTISQ